MSICVFGPVQERGGVICIRRDAVPSALESYALVLMNTSFWKNTQMGPQHLRDRDRGETLMAWDR